MLPIQVTRTLSSQWQDIKIGFGGIPGEEASYLTRTIEIFKAALKLPTATTLFRFSERHFRINKWSSGDSC